MKLAIVAAFGIAYCSSAVAQEPWTRAIGAPDIPASFGSTVDGIGDANRDGIPDIAVGMFGSGVSIYSGANGKRLLTANRPLGSGRAEFGFRVARAGDVDGDDCSDVAVSAVAPREWNGYVSIVSSATGKDIVVLRSEVPGDGFGLSLATGDIDDDGKAEIVVGAPHDCFAGECAGAVYVFSGATHKLLQLLRGREAGSHFGTTLLVARDLESDHRLVDLLIASRDEVTVFAGRSGRELRSVPGPSISLATCGDIDGDKLDEIAIGTSLSCTGSTNPTGLVRVFSGASGRVLCEIRSPGQAHVEALKHGDCFAFAMSRVGDVDSDGCADLAIGAPAAWGHGTGGDHGESYVISARARQAVWGDRCRLRVPVVDTGDESDDNPWYFATAMANAGDVDRDGVDDVVIGAPGMLGPAAVEIRSGKTGELLVQICPTSHDDFAPFAPPAQQKR